ncbi:MAG: type I-E CRISPR-associated protein Cse1/CasA [Gammaproteobacteria bacterium]|jgi:CRISPR system Cascade subunit CasA
MNLLTDPLLRVETATGLERMTLPGLMAALGEDRVEALTGIQRHQEEAFHVFLCSLAAAILARPGDTDPRQDESYWREGLRGLAGAVGDDAWTLVVEDLSKPAFMQPPLPKSDLAKLKPLAASPDALDLLPTAKNHDLKQSRAALPRPDEWIYALVSLQTMSGYFGRGNPGIARMNSGFGNRPIVELLHTLRLGARWHDAVTRLLTHRSTILDGPWGYDSDGAALVWTATWDGKQSHPLSGLDPNHVEIARRVRLRLDGDRLTAVGVPSDGSRLDAKTLNGLVGDGWLPVDLGVERRRAASPPKPKP